ERLGVDRVDILHIHDPDDHIDEALEGTYPALVELRDQGMIGAVSLGTNSVATAAVFLERADLDCMLVAGRYTLLDRSAAELIDACARRGVAYLAAGVFNSGVLARPRSGSWYDYGPASDETLARAAAIDDVCRRHGVSLRAAALNFPLTNPNVTAVVVGMAAPAEVDENLEALSAPVPDELWRELQGMELQA
ncbi:MAG: aldo/keto reductase, partial [Acidimicrobiaceae bacterium]|nr:aldo/keto reductase [Acidimicrobiaceae bacterium]